MKTFITQHPYWSALIALGVLYVLYYAITWYFKRHPMSTSTNVALGSGTSTGLDQRVVNGGLPSERKSVVINERLKGGGVPSSARVVSSGQH